MSKAFTKEDDGAGDPLPDREVSPHPNLVTAEGFAQIETTIAGLETNYADAIASGDRDQQAAIGRELRYWTSRRSSAELVAGPTHTGHVQFGSTVALERDDGRRQTFRIVGEDQANPATGTLSYVSPLAQALMGRQLGDTVHVGAGTAEICGISIAAPPPKP